MSARGSNKWLIVRDLGISAGEKARRPPRLFQDWELRVLENSAGARAPGVCSRGSVENS